MFGSQIFCELISVNNIMEMDLFGLIIDCGLQCEDNDRDGWFGMIMGIERRCRNIL